ncbi:hypothetical protein TRFO_38459 [Tritrichomonas foetus]|uniref:Aminotransferase class V domain-containing protein n=1 Tax=Tritrichomonas foetus TaxID=1144522 RepID=A0A1J4JDX0_9EUKA|nr:hypothetical protein TRFO_38459 [Tritrichomonas foetus]|eukprot:OHS95452.1 hypothetical protein TRFO_38459 [Tritrichomonas foetus]
MEEQIEEFINIQYPQLSEATFFDYQFTSPISSQQIQRIKKLSQKLIASPHSSEEQSDFDRTLALLRTTIAELFSTNLINYTVILFQTPEAAIDEIFESFPWGNNSHYVVDDSFELDIANYIHYAEKAGATSGNLNTTSKSKSLLLTTFSEKKIEEASQFQKKGFGLHHVLFDATQSAPFHIPNLTKNPFDFFLLSLKKICGIELCAMLIKLQAAEQLRPQFYGGGAVAFSCAREYIHRNFKSHTKRLENGTPPLVSIFAAYEGINVILKLNKIIEMSKNEERVHSLMRKMEKLITENFTNITCEVNEWKNEIIIEFVDCENPKDLQIKYIEKKVILGINKNNKLRASFGLMNREKDVTNFIDATKVIFS